jgi:FlaA1/EpsC-like NDP-sugar epimerase
MKSILLNIFKGRVVSPYWILFIDLLLVANSFFIAFTLRLSLSLPNYSFMEFLISAAWVLFVYLITFLIFGSYRGVIRHTNYSELKLLTSAYITAFGFLFVSDSAAEYFQINWIFIPQLALVFHFMFALFFAISFRMLVKETYVYLTKKKDTENAFIYGAGEMGLIAYEAINNDKNSK